MPPCECTLVCEERVFIKRRISAADCIEGGKNDGRTGREMHRGLNIECGVTTGSQLYPSLWPLDTFRLRCRGSRGGARCQQPSQRNIKKTHTHTLTHTCRVGVPWESTAVLQDQLPTGCWRGHAAPGCPGRQVDQCRLQRGPTYQTHSMYTVGAGVATHVQTVRTPSYLLFFNQTPLPAQRR